MFRKKPEELVIYGDGSYGRQVQDQFPEGVLACLQPHEYPTPERLEQIRDLFPEADLADYELRQTGPDPEQVSFIDKATGVEYRRDASDPFHHRDPRNCGIVAFIVDHGGRIHYLRPRGPRTRRTSRCSLRASSGGRSHEEHTSAPAAVVGARTDDADGVRAAAATDAERCVEAVPGAAPTPRTRSIRPGQAPVRGRRAQAVAMTRVRAELLEDLAASLDAFLDARWRSRKGPPPRRNADYDRARTQQEAWERRGALVRRFEDADLRVR